MVLNLFSELPVFVISVGSFITYKIANSLTFQVFVEIKWGNVCEVPSTVSCIQRLYSNLLIASIPPGTVSWGYLLYVLSRVYCLIFRMRREAPHGRMRAFFFLVTFTEQARGYSAQWFTPKVPFLSIWLFSIFQSSEYWPSFTDLSASSRHPVIHVISLKSFFFSENCPTSVALSLFYRRRNGSEELRNLPKFQWFVGWAVFHVQGVKLSGFCSRCLADSKPGLFPFRQDGPLTDSTWEFHEASGSSIKEFQSGMDARRPLCSLPTWGTSCFGLELVPSLSPLWLPCVSSLTVRITHFPEL